MQPVTSTRLPRLAQIIFNVQGTDIMVLATMGGSVFFWDAKLAVLFPFPAIETGGRITCFSDPVETPGTCSMAILAEHDTVPRTAHPYVITIKHEDGKSITVTSQSLSVLNGRHFESVFLTEGMVGTIVANDSHGDCTLTVGLRGDNQLIESMSVSGYTVSHKELTVTFIYRGHLYTLLNDPLSVKIHHVSQQALRSGHCEQLDQNRSEILYSSNFDNSNPVSYMIPSTSSYGISVVFVRREWNASGPVVTSFTFVPNALVHGLNDGMSSPLAFDLPCVTESIPGEISDLNLAWLDHSGFNLVAVIQPPTSVMFDPSLELVLVRYHPETRSSSAHTLAVPDTINLNNLDSLCVDDTAGAVHLVDEEGVFSTLRYV